MQRKQPNPRRFSTFEAFEAAYVDWATADLPGLTHYDSLTLDAEKRHAIYVAAIEAADAARDLYDRMLEDAAEDYERGVGPAWAD